MNRQEKLEQGFVSYMQKKYKEDFTFREWKGSHIGNGNREAYMKSDRFPEERIWVERTVGEDRTVTYRDNYMGYYYQDEIKKLVEKTTEGVFTDAQVNYFPFKSLIWDESDSPVTLEELLADTSTTLHVTISLSASPKDRDAAMELWRRNLKEEHLRLDGNIETQDGSETGHFAMDEFYEFLYLNWR
ncbi:MAG: hypothetical protein PHN80_10695 [Hespellia sp.]|nr:hypothetical protein [Hespellia sp.]